MILLKKPRVVGFKGRWILPHQKVSHFLINPAVFPSPICSPPCRGWSHGGGPRSQSAVRWRGRSGSNTCGRNLWIWTHEHTTRDTHVHEYNKVNHTWLCVECSSLDMWGWCTCVCVCVSRWCGTDLPGLSRSPPVGFWQHRRMYSCKACCSNIQRCRLSSDSPEQTDQSHSRISF